MFTNNFYVSDALEDFEKVSACNGPNVRQTIQGNDESISHTSELVSYQNFGDDYEYYYIIFVSFKSIFPCVVGKHLTRACM